MHVKVVCLFCACMGLWVLFSASKDEGASFNLLGSLFKVVRLGLGACSDAFLGLCWEKGRQRLTLLASYLDCLRDIFFRLDFVIFLRARLCIVMIPLS